MSGKLILWLVGTAAAAGAQGVCPPLTFRTESSANLAVSASSHMRLARQNDGSYTGFEVADASPYAILSVTPDFAKRLTPCSLTNFSNGNPLPETMARLGNGDYLYVGGVALPGQAATVRTLRFSAAFRFLAENDYSVNGVVALGDLNGDGYPDLVTGTGFAKSAGVSVLAADGTAGFHLMATYGQTAFTQIAALAVGDVDGDGKADVAVAAIGATNPGMHIWVLYGNGDGTLQDPVRVADSWGNQAIAIGDLNHDGIPDLAYTVDGYVEAMLGRGGRGFGEPVPHPTIGSGGGVAIGDVDGDGNPDVVTNGVTVWFGDGKGGFPRYGNWFNDAPGNVILTDFNGDGRTDIVLGIGTADVLAGNRVSVLYNLGGGDFSGAPVSPLYTSLNYGIQEMQVADLNRDGIPDVVLSDLSHEYALLGSADGSFRLAWTAAAGFRFAVGDFNGDGIPDLVASSNPSGGSIAVSLGRGDGTFAPIFVTPIGSVPEGFAVGDFNGDGRLDAAVLVNGPQYGLGDSVLVYPGDGKGGLGTPVSHPVGPVAAALAVGDFNGDGRLDIAVAATGAYQMNNGEITILLNTGSGFVRSDVAMGSEGPYSVTAADLNGDGAPDLAVQCTSGRSAILLNRGGGSFGAPSFLAETIAPAIWPTVGFAAADLNGDGKEDLIGWGGNPGIWIGNGDGTFQPEIRLPQLFGSYAAARLDQRGRPDVIGAYAAGVVVFRNETLPRPRRR